MWRELEGKKNREKLKYCPLVNRHDLTLEPVAQGQHCELDALFFNVKKTLVV